MFGCACIGLVVVGLHSFLTKTMFICSVILLVFALKNTIYVANGSANVLLSRIQEHFVSEVNEWHCKIVQLCVQQRGGYSRVYQTKLPITYSVSNRFIFISMFPLILTLLYFGFWDKQFFGMSGTLTLPKGVCARTPLYRLFPYSNTIPLIASCQSLLVLKLLRNSQIAKKFSNH